MKTILLLLILLMSAPALALDYTNEFHLKFGGWSKHIDEQEFDYNESHKGSGLEYFFADHNSRHYFGVGFWYMKDSYNFDANHIGAIYQYRPNSGYWWLDNFYPSISMAVANRGWRNKSGNSYVIEKETRLLYYPSISVNLYDYATVDVMYAFAINDAMPDHTWFARLGINLTSIYRNFK